MHALLLSSAGRRLLVPRTLVAEVVSAAVLSLEADAATGTEAFSWRGRRVPLLHAAALGDEPAPADGDSVAADASAVVVLHGLRQQQALPYYGLRVTRSPRLLRLEEDDLQEIGDVQLHPAELMRVRVEGEEASIPKVDQLESVMLALLKPAAR